MSADSGYGAGVLVVHAGNRIDGPDRVTPRFPAEREAVVADRLGELLDLLVPDGVVTSAAAGADLLIVEASVTRGVPVHLHLPCPRSRFRAASVADLGERWTTAFEQAVAQVESDESSSIVELDLQPDLEGFLAQNHALVDYACRLATAGLVAVAVRPAGGEEPPSVSDDFVRRAADARLFVIEIDPLS